MKESFSVEYGLKKGSTKVLWKLISTANGLSEWMADRVIAEDNVYSFTWGKGGDKAILLEQVPEERVRFRWLHEPEYTYFEIAMTNSELTGEITLTITDFAEPGEQDDLVNLWNSEVDALVRRVGL